MILKKKKFTTLFLSIVLGAFAMVGLTACGDKNGESQGYAQDFYAMSAISSFNFLQKNVNSQTTANSQALTTRIQTEDAQNISEYMGMFQDMLASDTSNYYTNEEVAADDVYANTYNFKMSLSVPSLNGEQQDFVMYYNELYTDVEQEYDDDEVGFDEIELEINTTLSGIIVYDNAVYKVEGEREYEQEGNETEISIEFKAYLNDMDYILVEHEMEDKEVEYQYTIFQNGQESVTEVEFENERNSKKLELEFENNSASGESEVKYEITQSSADENVFNVRVKNSVNDVETGERFTITVTSEGYIFNYSDGSSETILY